MQKTVAILGFSLVAGGSLFGMFSIQEYIQAADLVSSSKQSSITFKQSSYQVREGDTVRITVTAPSLLSERTVVKVKVKEGSAQSSLDYRFTTQTLTFYPGGFKDKGVYLSTIADRTQENNETIVFELLSERDVPLGSTATVSIHERVLSVAGRPGGSFSVIGSSTATTTPGTFVNLNSIPSNTALDARGWPAYLNVPADCAPATTQARYFFEMHHNTTWSAPSFGGSQYRHVVRNWFLTMGAHRWTDLAEGEVYAMPFITTVAPNAREVYSDGNLSVILADQYGPGAPVAIPDLSISRCPGDFTRPIIKSLAPAGMGNSLGASVSYNQPEGIVDFRANLRPNTRYFLNMAFTTGQCRQQHEYLGNPTLLDRYKRNGNPLCGFLGSSSISGQNEVPPYTGPAVTRAPYPLNYNFFLAEDGMCRQGQGGPGTVASTQRWRCFDVTGAGQEQRFEAQCQGTRWQFTTGANGPSMRNYSCVAVPDNNGEIAAWETAPTWEICARHTEGVIHRFIVNRNGREVDRQETTCTLDQTNRVYGWRLTRTPTGDMGMYYQASSGATIFESYVDRNGSILYSR